MKRALISAVVALAGGVTLLAAAFASGGENVRTPDAKAVPQLSDAKITLVQGIKQVEAKYGPAIEAKFELDDSGALSLSVYPAAKGLKNDAEFNVFEEASGPAAASPWKPSIEVFKDAEHLTRSAFDLTLMQQSKLSLARAVQRALAQQPGTAYWAVPILRGKKPAIGIYIRSDDGKSHHLVIPAT